MYKDNKNFTIIVNSQLGKGGFGQIYLGRNIKENKKIAIKVENKNENKKEEKKNNIVLEQKDFKRDKNKKKCC